MYSFFGMKITGKGFVYLITIVINSGRIMAEAFSEVPEAESPWALESEELTAQHIKVNALSELTDDAGILVSGKLQSATNGNFIDLNAIDVIGTL